MSFRRLAGDDDGTGGGGGGGGGPPVPPGSTYDALAAGSINRRWVLAIEGYEHPLTDVKDPDAAIVAWAGTDWANAGALGGLYVNLEVDASLNPWVPFTVGGHLTFRVAPDRFDTFGVDTHRKAGAETFLDKSLDCNDGTAQVRSAGAFTAPGTVYIGTEAIGFTGVASSPPRLTGLTRGKFSPFLTASGGGFAHPHSVTDDPLSFQKFPVASLQPRHWVGKWTGLWMHRYSDETGLMNVKDDAQLVFAGRIKSIRDNPQNTVDVEVEHVLTLLADVVLGQDMWSATVKEGLFLQEGWVFSLVDTSNFAAGFNTAQPLVVGGTPGPYVIQPGRYEIGPIISKLNAWLHQAKADGDIAGTHELSLIDTYTDGIRTKLQYFLPGSGNAAWLSFSMPEPVWRFLGKFHHETSVGQDSRAYQPPVFSCAVTHEEISVEAPKRFINNPPNAISDVVLELENERGKFVFQGDTLPASIAALVPGNSLFDAGTVILDGTQPAVVTYFLGGGGVASSFRFIKPILLSGSSDLLSPTFEIAIGDPRGPITVQQYFHFVEPLKTLLKKLFYSTGTTGFNHYLYDVYPQSLSCGIPAGLLGPEFDASVDALPNSDLEMPLIVTKPTKLVDLLGGDLKIRFAFLRWKDQGLQFWTWMTPVGGIALSESNKASPVGTKDDQRSSTLLDETFTRNVVKLQYERDFTLSDSNSYHKVVAVVDRVAIDDSGGPAKVETISAQNTYSQFFLGGSAGIEHLIPRFMAIASMFTEPVSHTDRPIDSRFWERLAIGDDVIVSDNFARDPDTGRRRVIARPGIIIKHHYNPGGPEPGASDKPRDMTGGVEIMFLPLLRVGPYVPTAQVDHAATGGGYDDATHTITTTAHTHSPSSTTADASWMSAGRKVRIVEIDPADPAAPLSWDRIVSSQTGNAIVLTAALSAPAWDADKHYRVIFDDFADVIANQQAFSFQADVLDGMVADLRAPYQYTVGTAAANLLEHQTTKHGDSPTPFFTPSNSPADQVELPPDSAAGDGTGLDVGTQAAINRLVNNLLDYKTAKSSPMLLTAPMSVLGDVTHEWKLLGAVPFNTSSDNLTTSVKRALFVAPMFRSSDGTSVSVRVTLARSLPGDDSLINVNRGLAFAEATFSTTSTDYTRPTAQALDIGSARDPDGNCYLLIELKAPTGSSICTCVGLATCYEGPRH